MRGRRARAAARAGGAGSWDGLNARLPGARLEAACRMDTGAKDLIESAALSRVISARGLDRLLRVARTVADLDGAESVRERHVAEALHYRPVQDADGSGGVPTGDRL